MRRFAVLLLLLSVQAAASAQDFNYIAGRAIEIESKIVATKDPFVIVIGDSLTQSAPWPDRVCGLTLINGGAAGSRTSYMLPLVEELIRLPHRPATIVIATGMNDAHKTLWLNRKNEATFLLAYRAIVQAAMNVSPKVMLATLSPVDFSAPIGDVIDPDAWHTLNKRIAEIGAEFRLTVIDNTSLKSEGPLTRDGVHFTDDGNKAFVEKITSDLRTELRCAARTP